MSLMIWIIIQIVFLLTSQQLVASVVLLPSFEQSFESYFADCMKENYVCTQTIIKEKVVSFTTPKYDQLILDLDLQSAGFASQLSAKIKVIIESEMISMDQLESLINILQRSEEVNPNKVNKVMRVELTQLQEMVNRAPVSENFKYFIFKKPISAFSMVRLKSFSFTPLFKEINFKNETVDQQVLDFKTGACTKSQLSTSGHFYFSEAGYTFNEESDCSWIDSVTEVFKPVNVASDSKYKLTSKQKNIFLWSAVAIGAGLFLSQYELSVEY